MGQAFATKRLPGSPDVVAPDGSDVRILLRLDRGGMAQFELAAGQVSRAVAHRTVEEIWYVLHGTGEMWRRQDDQLSFDELGLLVVRRQAHEIGVREPLRFLRFHPAN